MIFLRPTILRDNRQSIQVTQSKYSIVKDAQNSYDRNVVQLWLEGDAPALPDFEGLLVLPPPFEDSKQPSSGKTLFDEPEGDSPDALDF